MFSGCGDNTSTSIDKPPIDDGTIVANISVSISQTRAIINDTGLGTASFAWEDGDEIGVVVGERLYKFTLTGMVDENTGSFMAELPIGAVIEDGTPVSFPYVASDYDENLHFFNLTYPTILYSYKEGDFRHRWAGTLKKKSDNSFYAELAHQTAILRVTYEGVPTEATSVKLEADKNIAGDRKTNYG